MPLFFLRVSLLSSPGSSSPIFEDPDLNRPSPPSSGSHSRQDKEWSEKRELPFAPLHPDPLTTPSGWARRPLFESNPIGWLLFASPKQIHRSRIEGGYLNPFSPDIGTCPGGRPS